jgi:hypothetical protein
MDGRFWLVLGGSASANDIKLNETLLYSIKHGEAPRLEFKRSGAYFAREANTIYFRANEEKDLRSVDCRKPEDDKYITTLIPPPNADLDWLKNVGLLDLHISPNGDKLFFIFDCGERLPLKLCSYDRVAKQFSKTYEAILGGGPRPVIISVPSSGTD